MTQMERLMKFLHKDDHDVQCNLLSEMLNAIFTGIILSSKLTSNNKK